MQRNIKNIYFIIVLYIAYRRIIKHIKYEKNYTGALKFHAYKKRHEVQICQLKTDTKNVRIN
jgi:hypothetical protein